MSIRNFLQRLRRRDPKSEAMEILGTLGCFNLKQGITPSMCNQGMINEMIMTLIKQGKKDTAKELENWLTINKWKLK